jgi:hypothetical protein
MKTSSNAILIAVVAALLLQAAESFLAGTPTVGSSSRDAFALQARRENKGAVDTRFGFLKTCGAAIVPLVLTPSAAFAAKEDPAKSGTKNDPLFQQCLGKCMYECTKPKGFEQKTRQECLPECKEQCAKTKEQLMKGVPLSN